MKLIKNQYLHFILIGLSCFLLGVGLTYFLLSPPQIIPTSDRAYFSHLHQEFLSAKKSIHIVMFEMRYYPNYEDSKVNLLLRDLIKAQEERGLDVKIILEGGEDFLGQDFLDEQREACSYLQESGVGIKFDPYGLTTHAKLVIIDTEKVFLGSTNWNYYALEENKETAVLIKDTSLAKKYETYFQNLWRISKEADCKIIPPKNCSSIGEILARRLDCDKKKVEINGSISSLKLKTSQAGNDYATFKITSQEESLKVFTFGHPNISEGDEVIVKGTYHKEKTISGYTYYDEVEAEEIEKI